VLVLPRILGLMIALPLLTIVADAMGLAGGAVLSWLTLDIPFNQFMVRMQEAIAPTTFWAGLLKAPVFAFVIALIGSLRGLQVRESSRELGRLTTVAVVQSIFMVLLGIRLTGISPRLSGWSLALPGSWSRALGLDERASRPYSDGRTALLGAATFFLPCGFTQVVQLYAMTTASPLQSGVVMVRHAHSCLPKSATRATSSKRLVLPRPRM